MRLKHVCRQRGPLSASLKMDTLATISNVIFGFFCNIKAYVPLHVFVFPTS